jgi:cytochrome b involved in lipid metabolism
VDVTKFASVHPGGSFLLKHNIGKDVSKFFYGGYSLDGNKMGHNQVGHTHSNFARKLVNRLTIAQYECYNESEEKCKLSV